MKVSGHNKFRFPVKAGPHVIGVAIIDRRHSAGVDELYARALARRTAIDNLTINGPTTRPARGHAEPPRHFRVLSEGSAAGGTLCAPDPDTPGDPGISRPLTPAIQPLRR